MARHFMFPSNFRIHARRLAAAGLLLASWAAAPQAEAAGACDAKALTKRATDIRAGFEAGKVQEAVRFFETERPKVFACLRDGQTVESDYAVAVAAFEAVRAKVMDAAGRTKDAIEAQELAITIMRKLMPDRSFSPMEQYLQQLKRKQAGGAAATPEPARKQPTRQETAVAALLAGLKLFQEGKTLQALEQVEPHLKDAELLSLDMRIAFHAQVGGMYTSVDRYAEAEAMLLKAKALLDQNPSDPKLSPALRSLVPTYLGAHYSNIGDYDRSVEWYQKAMGAARNAEDTIGSLGGMAYAQLRGERYAEARANAEKHYELAQKTYPADDQRMILPTSGLATVLGEVGEYARAEQLSLQHRDLILKHHGTDGKEWIRAQEKLGWLYRAAGDYRKSAEYYEKRMQQLLKFERPDSLHVANAKCQMAETLWNLKDYNRAFTFGVECNDTKERHLAAMLASGNEEQRRANVKMLEHETDVTITVGVLGATLHQRATSFALDTVLRRKGRVLDAMSDTLSRVRQSLSAEERQKLSRLANARSLLAGASIGGTETAELAEEVRRLEAELARKSVDYRTQSVSISTGAVQDALPADSVLVEIVSYRPYNFKSRISESHGPAEYVAFIVQRGAPPQLVTLGKAADIDPLVARLREALASGQDGKEVGRKLDARVMAPVRPLLKGSRKVFLSADGALNLVPFAALVDESGRYLLQDYTFTYLTSGRDLLRMGKAESKPTGVSVFANPDYQSQAGAASASKRAMGFALRKVAPLPGTAEEARAISLVLPETKTFLQAEATESAIKSVSRPRVLHIATHGFFLGSQRGGGGTTRALEYDDSSSSGSGGGLPDRLQRENPLLRSGLLFAGASNLKGGNNEDGVLTALEASSLDLRGTGLVVLSACETGVGEVRSGEGVYGLRRAFVMAGAESLVMSLWPVDDEATRDLMVQYYRRLQAGQGRSEALRQAQLGMLQSTNFNKPMFWAAFIPSGDPAPLDLGLPAPVRQTTTPPAADTGEDEGFRLGRPKMPWSWFRFQPGLSRLNLLSEDGVEEGDYGVRLRAEVSLLQHLIPSGTFSVRDSLGAQYVYGGERKSQKAWNYDLMLGFHAGGVALHAGARYGMASAQLGDLTNGGSFMPIVGRLGYGGLAITGWGARLAGERDTTGLSVQYTMSRQVWLDGGFEKAKGRPGEAAEASLLHLGVGFSL
jgi:CHAT domain-containing protein/tetratricopeptide (TPR) repeat protein